WLAIPSATTVDVWGQPLKSYTHSYTQQQGWDLTGSVFDANPLVSNPPGSIIATYGWDPTTQSYVAISPGQSLQPHEGYWIAVGSIPCTVTMGTTESNNSGFTKSINEAEPGTFHDKFGSMPPVPPPALFRKDKIVELPQEYGLSQNYPNPFNPETVIEFQLPRDSKVTLTIHNLLGQEVRTLVDDMKRAGYHKVIWDGKDDRVIRLPAGIYVYRIKVGEFMKSKKMLFLK
ncbi:MAG: T9SS type A sorting domain-containing protein, partial [bacterium]